MPPPRRSSPRWNGKCSRAIGSNHLARHRLLCLTGATGSTTTTVGTAPSAWSALSTTRTLRPPTGKPHRGNLHDSGGTTERFHDRVLTRAGDLAQTLIRGVGVLAKADHVVALLTLMWVGERVVCGRGL